MTWETIEPPQTLSQRVTDEADVRTTSDGSIRVSGTEMWVVQTATTPVAE